MSDQVLYLPRAAVEGAGVGLAEIEAAIETAFAAKAQGGAMAPPKQAFQATPESSFHVMAAALADPPLAGLKWIGVTAGNEAREQPHVTGLMIVSDSVSGVPLAVMDATWITAVRTAAVTAVAAKYLARPDSACLGFIACGVQARSHLAALRQRFSPRRVLAYARRRASAEAFLRQAAAMQLEGLVAESPRAVVAEADILVTSVPAAGFEAPFLDPAWLKPGSFTSAVDLGRSWRLADPEGNAARFDRVATDDRDQSQALAKDGRLSYARPFDADLGELITGAKPGRESPRQRILFIHPGSALADVAVAALVYQAARAKGLGSLLAL